MQLTSPITGGAQTGLTSPTFTIVTDVAPTATGRQVAVSALGGTQTNVRISSGADPFTINWVRPANFRSAPVAVNGVIGVAPKNVWKFIVRKGLIPVTGQAPQIGIFTLEVSVPAGSESADAVNIRAALSALFGAFSQQSAGFGDAVVSGVL
jgi:hypothetical protein